MANGKKSPVPKRLVIVSAGRKQYGKFDVFDLDLAVANDNEDPEESHVEEQEVSDTQTDTGRPKRAKKVPVRAVQCVDQMQADKREHEERAAIRKRKLAALERPNSSQPGPLSEANQAKKKQKQNAQTSILDYSIDQLAEEEDRIQWYLAAIAERDGRDLSGMEQSVEQLEQLWLHPSLPTDEQDQGQVSSKAKQTPIVLGNQTYVMEPKASNQAPSSKPKPKPLASLNSTDHTTIMPEALVNPKQLRGPDGKPVPETPLGKSSTNGSGLSLSNKPALLSVKVVKKAEGHNKSTSTTSKPKATNRSSKSDQVAMKTPSVQWQLSLNQQPRRQPLCPNGEALPASAPKRKFLEQNLGESTEQDDNTTTEEELDERTKESRLTKRQEAQLWRFGAAAKPLVSKLKNIIRLRAVTENPYADITVQWSEADKHGEQQPLGMVSEAWIVEEWDILNQEMRPGKPSLDLLETYIDYVTAIFSTVRNNALSALGTSVETTYKLYPNGNIQDNKKKVKDLLPDAFLSPTETPKDPKAFSTDVIKFAIKHCFFAKPGKSFGFHYPQAFSPMPYSVFALFAAMIQTKISHFSQGEYLPTPLDAANQVPFYNMYVGLLEKSNSEIPISIRNLQKRVFDFCHGNTPVKTVEVMEIPELDYGDDSEEEYVSKVIVQKPARKSLAPRQSTHPKPKPTVPRPTKQKPVFSVRDSSSPPQAGPSGTRHSSPVTPTKVHGGGGGIGGSGDNGETDVDDGDGLVEELFFSEDFEEELRGAERLSQFK